MFKISGQVTLTFYTLIMSCDVLADLLHSECLNKVYDYMCVDDRFSIV